MIVLQLLFGVIVPYAALVTFLGGMVYRVVAWAKVPVPFRIPTTCGQQKSLRWIKADNLENPHNILGVVGRMALEVLLFRSLFRNTRTVIKGGPRLAYVSNKYLWVGALVFHWCFLMIVLRHLRFFIDPVPSFVIFLQSLDGLFQIGVPVIYVSDVLIPLALGFLLVRRLASPRLRYISLPADYFPLLVLLGIVLTGVLMRHFFKTDVVEVKRLALGLFSLRPVVPVGVGFIFYLHLFFVSLLLAYFPFSKLVHMAGVFLSPTRNLVNNNRKRRHTNPWNYPVKVHTYEEYEDEFREKMKDAGIPVEKE